MTKANSKELQRRWSNLSCVKCHAWFDIRLNRSTFTSFVFIVRIKRDPPCTSVRQSSVALFSVGAAWSFMVQHASGGCLYEDNNGKDGIVTQIGCIHFLLGGKKPHQRITENTQHSHNGRESGFVTRGCPDLGDGKCGWGLSQFLLASTLCVLFLPWFQSLLGCFPREVWL